MEDTHTIRGCRNYRPVTKIVWDNYASISSSTAERFKIEEGTILNITSDDGKRYLRLPAHIQPGLNKNTVAIALGYGRKGTERFTNIGRNGSKQNQQ